MKMIAIVLCFLITPTICLSVTTPTLTPSAETILQDDVKPNIPSSRQKKWTQLVGKWFGILDLEGGGKYMWINERENDGTYKVHFRVIDPSGKRQEAVEIGEWGVSGDMYFTIYKGYFEEGRINPVDTTNPTYRDAYRILRLTSDFFEYESLDDGMRFSVKKVTRDFIFPEAK